MKKAAILAHLSATEQRIINGALRHILLQRNLLDRFAHRLVTPVMLRIERERSRLGMLEQSIEANNPARILQRGYGLIMHDGDIITNPQQVKTGDDLTVILSKGVIESVVK